ncbi:Arc family DNA-binding protein [Sulfitobacter guttiformis]|uniref:Arc-like DNA binding dprotein n=1 Tax=Sulfitobacter guttiformis TaxID=74349 RepID=A0A420DHJ9_9RHOB|nr:Arc family DNA-binding protein [Sulfitobacter guttiformis]KIN72556.1 Arc domain-containing protein [Sulfitobacter guttiformis KCTC 32187]RKE93699.1 Arc-like DNA binding dprotein [Sulfitobacter guttiformis]
MDENRQLSDKFMLRLPDGMRDRIKATADANNRSMNAEIISTLEKEYPDNFHEKILEDTLLNLSLAILSEDNGLKGDHLHSTLKILDNLKEDIEAVKRDFRLAKK